MLFGFQIQYCGYQNALKINRGAALDGVSLKDIILSDERKRGSFHNSSIIDDLSSI